MGVDHSKALLRITFHGLFIISQNERAKQWEIGVPCVPDHHFGASLRKITGSPTLGEKHLDTQGIRNIFIRPDPGVDISFFQAPGFDREKDEGDVNDYRWILDMEGEDFNNTELKLRTPLPDPPCPPGVTYKTKIFVKGGALYTDIKTVENYKRVKDGEPSDVRDLYKLAITAGINLPRAGSKNITLEFEGHEPLPLLPDLGIRHELLFTHTPQDDVGTAEVTHFRHYYEVLSDDDDNQFDVLEIKQAVPPPDLHARHTHAGGPATPTERGHVHPSEAGGGNDPSGANEPQVCNGVILGTTKTGLP